MYIIYTSPFFARTGRRGTRKTIITSVVCGCGRVCMDTCSSLLSLSIYFDVPPNYPD